MNIRLNVLSETCTSPNGCAFLYPLYRFRNVLRDFNIEIKFHSSINSAVNDCDVLLIENKFFRKRWGEDAHSVLSDLQWCNERVQKLFYMDITDSAGWDHAAALPYVTAYLKNQLLHDRTMYLQPMYGYRPFTDYIHNKYGVDDSAPSLSAPIEDPALLGRLGVGWNSGLADWSLYGPIKMALLRRTSWTGFFQEPRGWLNPSVDRKYDVSCRFGDDYARETVSWQRKQIRRLMKGRLGTEKLGRREYFKELQSSKIVVSPFGLGEITLKDFEVFLCGALLLKPDMSHLETWPDLFVDGETIITHQWDLDDFIECLDGIISNYSDYLDIARQGQLRYQNSLVGEVAAEAFAQHLFRLLTKDWSKPWNADD